MRADLTRDQVNHPWFGYWHAKAAKARIPYDQFKELTDDQIAGLRAGLTRKQFEGFDYYLIEVVKRYSLPDAAMIRGKTLAEAREVGKKFVASEKVALAMGAHLRLGAESPLKHLPNNLVAKIGSYL